jgi:FHS family L-fucose permease-like MFS transporter
MAGIPSQKVVVSTEPLQEKINYTPALITLGVLYFMMGFITCLNDTLVPFFKKGFGLSYTQSSMVQFYFFLTYGLMSVPAGKIVEKLGYKKGMVAGFGIAALGASLFYPASLFHVYALFLAALFIVAIGIVLLQVAANPYVTVLGSPQTASSRLALIQGIGSLGTTLAPVFGAFVILSRIKEAQASSDAVKTPYLFIAAVLLLIALIVYELKLPNITAVDDHPSAKSERSIFNYRNLNLGIVAIFMYVGAEVAIGTYLTNYVADSLNIAEHMANSYVAYYWGGMLVGRLLGAFLLNAVRPASLLTWCALLAITLIGVSLLTNGYLSIYSMVAVGLCNAIMFAVIFSLAVAGLGAQTTKASGLLSSAIVGGAIISTLQGVIRDHSNWGLAFLLPVVCYAYIAFYGWHGHRSKHLHFEEEKQHLEKK